MKIMDLRRRALRRLFFLGCVLTAGALVAGCAGQASMDNQRVYIVRHAEKGEGSDAALTTRGQARAEALAELLQDKGIERVFSTDTLRTRSTAKPLAERLGVPIEIYDHREPGKLVARIRESGQNALIVGHSNTIAGLAEAFGAESGETVGEDEFDRLYVIDVDVPVRSGIRRYGN